MVPRSLRCSDPSSLFGAEDLFFCPGGSAKTAFPFFENYEEVNIVKEALNNILAAAKAELEQAQDAKALEDVRVRYLGKKGELTAILKQMGSLSAEERPVIGQLANQVRAEIETLLAETGAELKEKALEKRLMEERLDVTLPGKKQVIGHQHPLNLVLDELKEIFLGMGFDVVTGPEVELDYYNFEALNIPKNHPARDTQDTFYIDDNVVLRSQTSPMQVRTMEKQKPPIRVIVPGRVYRSDEVDATHSPMFHQIEGLVVDKGVTMADLKGTLEVFVKRLYGEDTNGAVPPPSLPLHRAQCGNGHHVLPLPWRRLPSVQGRRLDRDPGLRHGAPPVFWSAAASIRKYTAVLPLVLVWSELLCAGTTSMTCVCCMKTM